MPGRYRKGKVEICNNEVGRYGPGRILAVVLPSLDRILRALRIFWIIFSRERSDELCSIENELQQDQSGNGRNKYVVQVKG